MIKNLDTKKDSERRPPVVAVLGHIDHGKSTLIDYIRKTSVVEGEAGGITQHVGAYEITHTSKDGRSGKITILDTPGHEAFSNVRYQCVSVADVAVLVVSAEDGVKPQTLEALNKIKECSIPYLVAITKIDKPNADANRVRSNLAENNILVEGFGGDIPVVEVSAKTGKGVDELLDLIMLISDLNEKTGERDTLGSGVIIESRFDRKRGITAVGIIKNGTIGKSLFAATKGAVAPIRFLLDFEDNMVEELSFSSPIQITGWSNNPIVGEEFRTFLKKDEAIAFAGESKLVPSDNKPQVATEGLAMLPIVIKADTAGSLAAIKGELDKIANERIAPKVVSGEVGDLNENDIKLALTVPNTIVLSFNTKIDTQAKALAERASIVIFSSNIIYELTDKVKELLKEREPRVEVEEIAASLKILKVFNTAKNKQVVGGKVLSGTLKRGANVKIIRRDIELGQGKIKELQQGKVATDSVMEGGECGAMIESKIEIAPGDILNSTIFVTK